MEVKDMKKLLVENNYKITKQREIVFNVLNENKGNHLSPEELHEIASKYDKDLGIATVYRTLVIFDKMNIVHKLDFDDKRYRYEIIRDDDKHQHHHLLCKDCGKIIEVEDNQFVGTVISAELDNGEIFFGRSDFFSRLKV